MLAALIGSIAREHLVLITAATPAQHFPQTSAASNRARREHLAWQLGADHIFPVSRSNRRSTPFGAPVYFLCRS
jgi:hypothetical protein